MLRLNPRSHKIKITAKSVQSIISSCAHCRAAFFLKVDHTLQQDRSGALIQAAMTSLSFLVRRCGLLRLHLQFVHHLLDIWNGRCDVLCVRALRFRIDIAGQCDDYVLDSVLYALVESILDESGIQVPLDTLVQ